ncbi:MAG: hypothetical protein ACTHM6_15240 [Tepidisphaeraceae bacterium]
MSRHCRAVGGIGIVLLVGLGAARADELPTPADLQKLAGEKNWTGLLQATTRVLALRGDAAAAYNRVDVWMLKAEAQLQSNQYSAASESFTHAAAEKTATPEQADWGTAMAAVLKKSDRRGYQPKPTREVPHPAAIDIFTPANRKQAVAALLGAENEDLARKITKYQTTLEQGPVMDMVKQVKTMAPLDRVANGTAEQTDALQKTICGNWVAAVQTWSDTSMKKIEDLNEIASKMVQQQYRDRLGNIQVRQQKTGLTSPQQKQLTDIENQAKGLAGTFETVQAAVVDAGKTALEPAKATIQGVYDRADTVLKEARRPD